MCYIQSQFDEAKAIPSHEQRHKNERTNYRRICLSFQMFI